MVRRDRGGRGGDYTRIRTRSRAGRRTTRALVLPCGRPLAVSAAAALLKSANVAYRRSSGRFQKSGPVDSAGPMVTLVRFSCVPPVGLAAREADFGQELQVLGHAPRAAAAHRVRVPLDAAVGSRRAGTARWPGRRTRRPATTGFPPRARSWCLLLASGLPKPMVDVGRALGYCSQMWLPPPKNLSCTCSTVKPKPSWPLKPPCESALEYVATRRSLPSGLTGMS